MKTTVNMLRFEDVNTALTYADNYVAGLMFTTLDTNQVYVLNEAQEVVEVVNTSNNEPNVMHEQRTTNCINCGAPLTSHKCEYCGTKY